MRLLKQDLSASAVSAVVVLIPVAASVFLQWVCLIARAQSCDGYVPPLLAVNVRKVLQGVPLYGDLRKPPYGSLLFGPVVPWLAAPLTRLFGSDPIAPLEAGRLLTICSSIAVGLLIFWLGRRSGASASAALVASLAFLVSPVLKVWGAEFRVDMPALAFEIGGIALFEAGLAYPAIAMFAVAFFAKQTRVAGIAAVVACLLLKGDRRRAGKLAIVWLAILILITAALQSVYPYYWLNNYSALTPRYDFSAMPAMFGSLMVVGFGLFALALIGVVRKGPIQSVTVAFLIVTVIEDSALSTHWGSNMNYFLPSLAAAAIVAAPELDHILELSRKLPMAAQLLCGVAIAWAVGSQTWLGVTYEACDCGAPSSLWDARALEQLHSTQGVVLTDMPEVLLMNAAPQVEALDLMALGNMKARGTFDDTELISAIERRQFAAIALEWGLLQKAWRGRGFFWPELARAIARNYELRSAGKLPPYLAVPKTASSP